jgi:hypothetical protein
MFVKLGWKITPTGSFRNGTPRYIRTFAKDDSPWAVINFEVKATRTRLEGSLPASATQEKSDDEPRKSPLKGKGKGANGSGRPVSRTPAPTGQRGWNKFETQERARDEPRRDEPRTELTTRAPRWADDDESSEDTKLALHLATLGQERDQTKGTLRDTNEQIVKLQGELTKLMQSKEQMQKALDGFDDKITKTKQKLFDTIMAPKVQKASASSQTSEAGEEAPVAPQEAAEAAEAAQQTADTHNM